MSAGKKAGMDMTQGTIWNKILLFALPLAASSMLQQLFNSVDTAVVGRFASSEALAAVGSNGSLISLMINLFEFLWEPMLSLQNISVRSRRKMCRRLFIQRLSWHLSAVFLL